jgi:hypothetical protein
MGKMSITGIPLKVLIGKMMMIYKEMEVKTGKSIPAVDSRNVVIGSASATFGKTYVIKVSEFFFVITHRRGC